MAFTARPDSVSTLHLYALALVQGISDFDELNSDALDSASLAPSPLQGGNEGPVVEAICTALARLHLDISPAQSECSSAFFKAGCPQVWTGSYACN